MHRCVASMYLFNRRGDVRCKSKLEMRGARCARVRGYGGGTRKAVRIKSGSTAGRARDSFKAVKYGTGEEAYFLRVLYTYGFFVLISHRTALVRSTAYTDFSNNKFFCVCALNRVYIAIPEFAKHHPIKPYTYNLRTTQGNVPTPKTQAKSETARARRGTSARARLTRRRSPGTDRPLSQCHTHAVCVLLSLLQAAKHLSYVRSAGISNDTPHRTR